jgi:peptide/nickel transport system permease protein
LVRFVTLRGVNLGVIFAVALLIGIVLIAASAPLLPIPDPNAIATSSRLQPPSLSGPLLGTDELGRDIFSRLIWGARISLFAGVAAALAAAVLGTALGVIAAYRGGWVDELLMRLTDVLMAFPYILLAIAIAAALGPGLLNAMIAVVIASFSIFVRLVRSETLLVKAKAFVEAARASGFRDRRIICVHILPNVLPSIVILFALELGEMIISTSSLSFLGLGVEPPTADWGNMLARGRGFITLAPYIALIPGAAIASVVLAANFLGSTLRDVLDPTLRHN